mmetsp:Transcript_91004/g.253339  ORF Transcript_91004/g.253339 Transcript_91004/m.253339 type:complete len:253 (-) Transcript_91004:534-1292(-)
MRTSPRQLRGGGRPSRRSPRGLGARQGQAEDTLVRLAPRHPDSDQLLQLRGQLARTPRSKPALLGAGVDTRRKALRARGEAHGGVFACWAEAPQVPHRNPPRLTLLEVGTYLPSLGVPSFPLLGALLTRLGKGHVRAIELIPGDAVRAAETPQSREPFTVCLQPLLRRPALGGLATARCGRARGRTWQCEGPAAVLVQEPVRPEHVQVRGRVVLRAPWRVQATSLAGPTVQTGALEFQVNPLGGVLPRGRHC